MRIGQFSSNKSSKVGVNRIPENHKKQLLLVQLLGTRASMIKGTMQILQSKTIV